MENQSDLFLTASTENFNEIFVPNISNTIKTFPQEIQQIPQQIDSNEFFTDYLFNPQDNQFLDPSVTQFQFPMDYYSYSSPTVPFSDPLQFNYYYPYYPYYPALDIQDSMTQSSTFVPSNYYFSQQQNLQYFFIPQQSNIQYSDFTYPSDSQQQNTLDSSNYLSSIDQSNFVTQSLKSSHNQLNTTDIKNSTNKNDQNNNDDIAKDESKLEKKKQQNRAAAQKAREREKFLLVNLMDENESLMKVYEEKVEEIKRLNSILDKLKEEKNEEKFVIE
ncbi:hypothetical protein C1645_807465 [Glomus cerebriforme]|uniref:BZIP domain-containing protein n=1 Tax=Glomus cerebriforme TaxID=658196 RepID=A0A397SWH2_9GLOM|nr:hypothetical protein C1645_807465 [Glomus cerebriforme]